MPKRAISLSTTRRPRSHRGLTRAAQAQPILRQLRVAHPGRPVRSHRRLRLFSPGHQPTRSASIAVVIPCYNGALHLDAAIRSALNQSYPVSSVIVVDDASTDRSVAIAESYVARGFPVRCLRSERNGGPATARNMAIAEATEPLVAFLDADDQWTEDHCASLVRLLVQHPDVDLAFSRTRSTDSSTPESALPVPARQPLEMLEMLLNDSFVPQSGVIARRSGILAVGGYTDGLRYSEDYDLWLRMAHNHRFIASGAATCIRGAHLHQATQHSAKMYEGAWNARARYWTYANATGLVIPPDRYSAICARAYEQNLAEAWRSRSLPLLWSVLGLADVVPDAEPIRARWTRRVAVTWPLWRVAALGWDTLPAAWRQQLNTIRKRQRSGRTAVTSLHMEMSAA